MCSLILSRLLLLLSCFNSVRLCVTLWTVARQAPLSMGFSRQENWSGLPCSLPGDLPNPGIEPRSLALQANSLLSEPPGKLMPPHVNNSLGNELHYLEQYFFSSNGPSLFTWRTISGYLRSDLPLASLGDITSLKEKGKKEKQMRSRKRGTEYIGFP